MRLGLDDIDNLLDVPDVAKLLGLSEATLYRMIARRDIDVVRIGTGRGRIKIQREAIVDYLNRRVTVSTDNEPKQKKKRAS